MAPAPGKHDKKRIQHILRVPLYPETEAHRDLECVQEMHPMVPRSKITKRALEIGLHCLATGTEDLKP